MKKLQVKLNGTWNYVFCYKGTQVITCIEKYKALPSKAIWGNDDLAFFSSKFGNNEFRLAGDLNG